MHSSLSEIYHAMQKDRDNLKSVYVNGNGLLFLYPSQKHNHMRGSTAPHINDLWRFVYHAACEENVDIQKRWFSYQTSNYNLQRNTTLVTYIYLIVIFVSNIDYVKHR